MYSLLNFGEYGRNQSIFFAQLFEYKQIIAYYSENTDLFSAFGKSCYLIRAPPRKSEPEPNPIQIFGDKKMSKVAHLKIFPNFFQNHQVSLGVFLLGLFIGPERKGVSTWAYTSAA